jgi:pimeloyl-ACP methyl ester carboxylesterase
MRRSRYVLVAGIGVAAMLATAVAFGTAATADNGSLRSCQTVTIPVALHSHQPADQRVSAEYCTPYGEQVGTVDVLVPGATYNHTYWDWPQDSSKYSYTDKTLSAGRAVLAIDRLGTGASSKPLGTSLTVMSSAYVLHQVVGWVRDTKGYGTVDVVGHSLGSAVVAYDAAQWTSDPTRVVLTGFMNEPTTNLALFVAASHPVLKSPTYITTDRGMRGKFLYDTKTADPNVISYDEAHKDVVSATELATALTEVLRLPTKTITAPVYLVNGQEDALFCGGVRIVNCSNSKATIRYEQPYYRDAASFSYDSVPDTGHSLALAASADKSFDMINSWIQSH